MTYRPGGDRDLRSIASVLGVANVVEGTVRRDGNRVRITIRLVDARTDETLWSEIYERSLTDIFAIQSDIAQKVAINLAAQLSPKERKQIREKPTKNIEAYDLYFSFSPYSWANSLVPRGCHEVWLTALQRGHPIEGGRFGSARDQLKQKAEAQPEDTGLMSTLGLVDSALGRKQEAIREARRAVEMRPISKDAVEGAPLVTNLALVYAWTNEPNLALQELTISVRTARGVHYGELKLDPA